MKLSIYGNPPYMACNTDEELFAINTSLINKMTIDGEAKQITFSHHLCKKEISIFAEQVFAVEYSYEEIMRLFSALSHRMGGD